MKLNFIQWLMFLKDRAIWKQHDEIFIDSFFSEYYKSKCDLPNDKTPVK